MMDNIQIFCIISIICCICICCSIGAFFVFRTSTQDYQNEWNNAGCKTDVNTLGDDILNSMKLDEFKDYIKNVTSGPNVTFADIEKCYGPYEGMRKFNKIIQDFKINYKNKIYVDGLINNPMIYEQIKNKNINDEFNIIRDSVKILYNCDENKKISESNQNCQNLMFMNISNECAKIEDKKSLPYIISTRQNDIINLTTAELTRIGKETNCFSILNPDFKPVIYSETERKYIPMEPRKLSNGKYILIAEDDKYTRMIMPSTDIYSITKKYYEGKKEDFTEEKWNTGLIWDVSLVSSMIRLF